jgi:hypothetical protein
MHAASISQMQLAAELRGTTTGALVALAIDINRDPDASWLHPPSQVGNIAATCREAAVWA